MWALSKLKRNTHYDNNFTCESRNTLWILRMKSWEQKYSVDKIQTGWWDGFTVELRVGDQVHIWAKVLLWLQPWKRTSGSLLPRAAEAAAPERSGCEPKQIKRHQITWVILFVGFGGQLQQWLPTNQMMQEMTTCFDCTGVTHFLTILSHLRDQTKEEIQAHLCGLSLLLKLLELLCCDKADWFVPCDQLCASRHGGQDDVPAQTADAAQKRGKRTKTYQSTTNVKKNRQHSNK